MFEFWPDNRMWSYQLVRARVTAHFGGGDIGEMLFAAGRMRAGDLESWHREWLGVAQGTADLASAAPGPLAESAWRRAATYYRLAGFFLHPDDPRELALYRQSAAAFRRGMPQLAEVRIPFEGRHLHGYFALPQHGRAPFPTLILMGGLESVGDEVYFAAGAAARAAGFACLVLEGPGQGGTLRTEGLVSRFAYEHPVSAAVDYLQACPEVDAQRIGMIAYSLGGYYVCRAAAFEHRLGACVAWGAEYDYAEVWKARPDTHPLAPHVMHTLGASTMSEARALLQDFHLRGVAEQISCPTLVVHGEEDFHVPLSHAMRTHAALRCTKALTIFPAGQPGSIHCQWDVPHRVHQVMFAWMQQHLGQPDDQPAPA